jgi:spoIIIJ-associated protein
MDAQGESGARDEATAEVAPEVVGEAASEFMTGLVEAFGAAGSAAVHVDGSEIDVRVDGDDLGLLIGPGGRTLLAVQDLARVASQRRLGDHDTRLRIDVAGYRERRREALEKFATAVATEVLDSGRSKALEPMLSADRKVVHDVVQGIDGVESHSDGEEPRRRVVITPA